MKNSLTKYDNDVFGSNWLKNFFDIPIFTNSSILKTNIRKEGDSYVYEVDVPGYRKEDISISYEEGYLIVEAKKQGQVNNSNDTYIRQERYSGTCSRSYYVGEIDESKISAKCENGILCITFKEEKDKKITTKKINIE